MAQRLSGSLNKGTDVVEYIVDCDPHKFVGLGELDSLNSEECQYLEACSKMLDSMRTGIVPLGNETPADGTVAVMETQDTYADDHGDTSGDESDLNDAQEILADDDEHDDATSRSRCFRPPCQVGKYLCDHRWHVVITLQLTMHKSYLICS